MTLTDPGLVASHTPTEIQAYFNEGKTVICRLADDNGYYFAEVNYKGSEGYLEIVCTKSAYTTGEGGGYSAEVAIFRGLLSSDTWVGVGSENVPTASDLSDKLDKRPPRAHTSTLTTAHYKPKLIYPTRRAVTLYHIETVAVEFIRARLRRTYTLQQKIC